MTLTKRQIRTLDAYRTYNKKPMTMMALFVDGIPGSVLTILIHGLPALLFYYAGNSFVAWLIAAYTLGKLARDLDWIYESVQVWPVVSKVIDFKRINELLVDERSPELSD